ncbi:MAG: hydroxymethylglutaryl-CoA lyase [Gammaproteobacteria bacterium]|nr:hydroxymethylglutaryl-CoA lyase [Gammaproteobacteria bacterium]
MTNQTESMPRQVRVVEVGPRDGLQNEKQAISTELKLELIQRLGDSGLRYIEAGSFVNPKWVPQMAGSEEVFQRLQRQPGVTYAALTPNLQGFERALSAGVEEVAVFAAASEGFSQKNINCSIAESIQRFEPLMLAAKDAGIAVRGYVSCVVGCPYDGEIDPTVVRDVSAELLQMGCYEVSLGDTIGVGTPRSITTMLDAVASKVPVDKLGIHCHDTYGMAIANIYAALQMGVASVDSSVAGLGGCPYAKGASGNVATEDVVYLLNGLGIEHGVDLDQLVATGQFISAALQRGNGSRVGLACAAAAG